MNNTPTRPFNRRIRPKRGQVLLCLVAGAGVLSAAACMDLQVNNPNTLNFENVFNNNANAEAALIGGWRRYWASVHGNNGSNQANNCPTLPFSLWGNELTSTSTALEFAVEPRQAINNVDNLNCATRGPWYDIYQAAAAGREVYQGIEANNLKFGTVNATTPDGADTPRIKIFSKFIIAISQLYIGLEFDKGFITDVTTPGAITDGSQLKPATEVVANAIQQLRGVIADAKAAPNFTLPTTWINGRAITRDELVRIAYGYIIRGEVYAARTPAQREAVNWALVLAQLDSGITTDFVQQAEPLPSVGASPTRSQYITTSFSNNTVRVSNRLLGPADTSGTYQAWLAAPFATRNSIVIATPDRRIHGLNATTNRADPAVAGTLFANQTTVMGSSANGSYLLSRYRSTRFLNASADSGSRALVATMSVREMSFIRAEALYRLGRFAEVATILNATRVPAGLQPVTASGPPAGANCVPRKNDGTCGDLFDALQYEKRIVLFPLEAGIAWWDQRGWGKLTVGTPLELPVSGREMVTLGLPIYTYGGTAGGGAPAGNP